jgi:hypothetical protein
MAKVGIFWVYKGKVIGKARDESEGIGANGWIDSPDGHPGIWETEPAFKRLCADGKEYQGIPRGRLVWQPNPGVSVIYMDKKLLRSDVTKKKVATFFGLDPAAVQWKSDPHYTTDQGEIAKLLDE